MSAFGAPPPRKSIAAPAGADAVALAAFDSVLAHVDALAHLSGGLFTGGGKFGGAEGDADAIPPNGAIVSASGAAVGEFNLSVSPPSPTSSSLRALRETLHAAGATDAVAALLQVSVFRDRLAWDKKIGPFTPPPPLRHTHSHPL